MHWGSIVMRKQYSCSMMVEEGLEEKWSSRKVSLPCTRFHCPMGIVEDMYNKYATNYPNHYPLRIVRGSSFL